MIDEKDIIDVYGKSPKPELGPVFITADGSFINIGADSEHSAIFGGGDYGSDDYYALEDDCGMIKANGGNKREPFPYIDIWSRPNEAQTEAIIDWMYFLMAKGRKTIMVNNGNFNERFEFAKELPEDIMADCLRRMNGSLSEKLLTGDGDNEYVRIYESPYEVKDFLMMCDGPQRIYADEGNGRYLVGNLFAITHLDMIGLARKNAYPFRMDDFDPNQVCLIFIGKEDPDYDDIRNDALENDDYDAEYDYGGFTILSRYQDFGRFKLCDVLGKHEKTVF